MAPCRPRQQGKSAGVQRSRETAGSGTGSWMEWTRSAQLWGNCKARRTARTYCCDGSFTGWREPRWLYSVSVGTTYQEGEAAKAGTKVDKKLRAVGDVAEDEMAGTEFGGKTG